MKKLLSIVLLLSLALSLVACGGTAAGNQSVTSNENITVDGLYVDTSYTDSENTALKMVYAFLTINATDTNLSVDCKYTKLNIGENNSYESDFYKGACKYMPNYYYSSFVKDVSVGTELKLAMTFKVPQADLEGSKTITFSDTSFPFDGIKMNTDDIVSCSSIEEIGQKADTDGCATMVEKYASADQATIDHVKSNLNGYYWSFSVGVGSTLVKYELEFMAPNKFEVRSMGMSNTGTYEVTNGFLLCTYPSNNHTVEIPYDFNSNGELTLECTKAFSIYE